MLRDDYKNLSVPEKILLVEEIWDSIAEDSKIKVSKEQQKLLEAREKDVLEGKVKTKKWEEIKGQIKRKGK
ncbi:MAG: putative addiction module component [Bacteroidota bacterium]|nr:putative addiction module component [Bacteroidota bacterium]